LKIDTYNSISALLAFLLWGGWTYLVNISGDNVHLSALVQGSYSAVMTLAIVCIVHYFYQLLPKGRLFFLLPSVISVTLTTILIVVIHLSIDTYDIFYTVLPTVVVAFVFSLYTTHNIKQGRAQCLLMKPVEDR